jgi:ATP-dependent Clp protease ATP-binding subunit ClpA
VTERSIRLPTVERQGTGVIMRPGGRSVPWPPQDDGLAEDLRRTLAYAQDEATRLGHNHVSPPHLLVGLLIEPTGVAARTLGELGVTLGRAREALESSTGRGEAAIEPSEITITPRAQRVIDMARYESRRLAQSTAGTEHLLLALLYEREHFTTRLMEALGVETDVLRDRTLAQLRVPASYRAAEHADLREGPYERFDEASRQVLSFARDEATTLEHSWIGDEHILLGLARVAQNAASEDALRHLFAGFGLTVDRLREEVAKVQPPRPSRAPAGEYKFTPNVKLVIELAIHDAGAGNVVRPEHLLAAVGAARDSRSRYLLKQFGIFPADLRSLSRGDLAL